MRTYFFVLGTPADLEIEGCRYVADPRRGHGAELQIEYRGPEDYPSRVALVTPLGGAFQVVPIMNDGGALLARFKRSRATVYDTAKAFALAQPAMADAWLYERLPVLDKDGQPTTACGPVVGMRPAVTAKVVGAPLRVATCFAGDDAAAAADPAKVDATPVKDVLFEIVAREALP